MKGPSPEKLGTTKINKNKNKRKKKETWYHEYLHKTNKLKTNKKNVPKTIKKLNIIY